MRGDPATRRILALLAVGLLVMAVVVAVATASYELGSDQRAREVRDLQGRVEQLELEVDLVSADVQDLLE